MFGHPMFGQLGHLGKALREFTIVPKDKSKISLKILHFPLPVG